METRKRLLLFGRTDEFIVFVLPCQHTPSPEYTGRTRSRAGNHRIQCGRMTLTCLWLLIVIVFNKKKSRRVYIGVCTGGGSRTHQTDLSHLRVTCYFVYHLERRLNMKMNAVETSTVTRQVYADMNNAKYSRKFQINSSIVLQCHEVIMCCCSHSMAYFSYGVSRHIHSSTSRSTCCEVMGVYLTCAYFF